MRPDKQRILLSLAPPVFFLFIFCVPPVLEWGLGMDFTTWGIYPMERKGIMGIFTHPLVHAGFKHLLANALPFLFLSWCLFYFYRDWGWAALGFIWVAGGLFTFLIGTPGWHVGASGLVYGLAFFLFFSGILRKHPPLVAISLLVAFLYGSIVWEMFPYFARTHVSWEGHLSGALAGTLAAALFARKGPQRHDPFEDEEDEEEGSETNGTAPPDNGQMPGTPPDETEGPFRADAQSLRSEAPHVPKVFENHSKV